MRTVVRPTAPTANAVAARGDYPGEVIIPRLFTAHVFLLPGLLLALVALHLALVWHQKHTQGRGQRATERNEIGRAHV